MAATPEQITQLYQQYLGRAPSQDEIDGWVNGTYGPDPATQIPQSGEAQQYQASHPQQQQPAGTTPTSGVHTTGTWWSQQPPPPSQQAGQTYTAFPGQPGGMPAGTQTAGVSNLPGQQTASSGAGYTGGADPQQLLTYLNAHPGADASQITGSLGSAAKYYAPGEHGAGQGAYVGFANGYLAQTPQGWQYFPRGPETGGGGSGSPNLGGNNFAGYGGGNPAGFGAPPAPYQSAPSTVPQYQTPAVPGNLQTTYSAQPFVAPTGVTEQNDPGYQFRLQQGQQGMERSAAAKGSVLSGGFQQALAQYNQDYASNEFQNVYNRALGTSQTNNQTSLNQATQNQNVYQSQVGNAQNQYGLQYQGYLNDQSRQLQDYLTNTNIQTAAQNSYWGRLKDLSTTGATAAGNPGP